MRGVGKTFKLILFIVFFVASICNISYAKEKTKVKFYNFDELLVDGKIKKPKVLFLDSRGKVKFDKLLKLKKSFIPKLKGTNRDPVLR
jgi:hypothetical protein